MTGRLRVCRRPPLNCRPVGPPFGFSGLVVPSMSWAGARFDAVVQPDWDEIDRRRADGLNALTDFQLMRSLRSLPHGVRVGWEAIDPVMGEALNRVPAGVVDSSPVGVLRLLRPAVELTGVYTASADPAMLDWIGLLAFAAPAGLVLSRRPPEPELAETAARAERFGLGLAVWESGHAQVLRWPRRRVRPSFNRARLLEAIYSRWADIDAAISGDAP